jgi:cytochrome b6-f complex iron-sulfur subunit
MTEAAGKKSEASNPPASRRRFLSRIWLALGGLAIVELLWLVGSFLRPRGQRTSGEEKGRIIIAGPAENFEPDSVTAFQQGEFYLVRLEDGGFLALHRECTHLGCTVPWVAGQKRFACPCHSSTFDIRGNVISPPAPRALDLLAIRIENGIVKVDTGTRTRRASFDPAQIARL